MALPVRKPLRLRDYDYAQGGAYFITICTKEKAHTLGTVVGGDAHIAPRVLLSPLGELVQARLRTVPGMEKFVVMPNHLHFVTVLGSGPMWVSAPTAVRSFKTLVTKQFGAPVWQRGYYDHIIRDESDFLRIWRYIDENPARWADDEYYTM